MKVNVKNKKLVSNVIKVLVVLRFRITIPGSKVKKLSRSEVWDMDSEKILDRYKYFIKNNIETIEMITPDTCRVLFKTAKHYRELIIPTKWFRRTRPDSILREYLLNRYQDKITVIDKIIGGLEASKQRCLNEIKELKELVDEEV